MPSLDCVEDFVPASAAFVPNAENHAVYEKSYQVFRKLYKANTEA